MNGKELKLIPDVKEIHDAYDKVFIKVRKQILMLMSNNDPHIVLNCIMKLILDLNCRNVDSIDEIDENIDLITKFFQENKKLYINDFKEKNEQVE